jgi:hypothetical protein
MRSDYSLYSKVKSSCKAIVCGVLSKMLCKTCQRMFYGPRGPDHDSLALSDWDHHYSPKELQKSADAECPICDTLWRRYNDQRVSINKKESFGLGSAVKKGFQNILSKQERKSKFSKYHLDLEGPGVIQLSIGLSIYFDHGLEMDWGGGSSLCNFMLRRRSGV